MIKLIISICLCSSLILGNPIPKSESYRLLKNVIPSDYDIELTVNDDKTFDGSVTIKAKVLEETNKIVLHGKDLEINEKDIAIPSHPAVKISVNLDKETDFITITVDSKLEKDEAITIQIKYKGKLRHDMYGLYLSSYGDNKDIIATQMEPTYARTVFPCFDEPNMKAVFTLTVHVPEKYTKVRSNMDQDTGYAPTPIPNKISYKFLKTNPMSTYLIALLIATDDFKSVDDVKNTNLKIWARNDAESQLQFAAKVSGKYLKVMDEYTNLKYENDMKMTKMDMAAIPDFAAGAMENWGLLTYRESALLFEDGVSTVKDKQRVASVIAHEQAHQWFGDLVTLDWWDNTWLNEGFATYFEYHTLVLKDGDELCGSVKEDDCWEMKKQFVIDEHQTALAADSVTSSSPLTKDVNTLPEIQSHFDAISYNKGGSIIRMMEHIIGSEIFKKGLNKYLTDNTQKNSIPENLFNSFTLDENVKLPKDKKLVDIMTNWIKESGYPIVSVSLDSDDKTVKLSQKKFSLDKDEEKDTVWWYIPISYAQSKDDFKETKPKMWLQNEEASINFDKDFIVLNVESTGYYRVNYDLTLLEKISDALSKDINNIPEINRAQLVDDVLNLARISEISYKDAFNNLLFLRNDSSYYSWSSAYSGYRFLLQRFTEDSFEGKELRKNLLNMMKGKVYPDEKIQEWFNDNNKETVIETYNRVNALQWACDLGDENCLNATINIYNEEDKSKLIPVNTKGVIYCSALRNNEALFEDLLEKFKKSNVAAEKELIIKALGCNTNKTRPLLDLSIDGKTFRTQDTQYAFQSAYTGTPEGVDTVLSFVTEKKDNSYLNWVKMRNNYGGMNGINKAISGLADRLTNEAQVKKLKEFLEANKNDVKDIKDSIEKTMDANLHWQDENKSALKTYFCSKYTDSDAPDSCKSDDDGDTGSSISASCLAITVGLFGVYAGRF